MTEINRTWKLNVAVTELNINTGKFDKETFVATVAPLRGKLMSHNGMMGCTIDRYSVTMYYDDDIIKTEEVEVKVREAVLWAATTPETKLFTLRDGVLPAVKRAFKDPAETPATRGIVRVEFNGYLTPFYTKKNDDGWDQEMFFIETHGLRDELVNIDGVLGYELHANRAILTVDLKIQPDLNEVEAHMRDVFKNASCGDFFPYLAGDLGLELAFSQRKE